MDHLGINLDQFLWVPSIGNYPTLPDLRYTLTLWGSQICNFRKISYINMDHLGINVDQFLWVPSIA